MLSIDQTLTVLRPLFGNSLALFTVAVGLTFTIAVFSVLYLVGRSVSPARRRVLEGGLDHLPAVRGGTARKIERAVAPYKSLFVPRRDKELGPTRARLTHAGYRGEEAVTVYYLLKALATIVFALAGGLIALQALRAGSTGILLSTGAGAALGMIVPSWMLDKRVKRRQTEIVNGFPDVLDLLVACTEAGLGLNAALARVARETSMIYPALSEELALVNSEIRTGADRVAALRGLATRTGVEDIAGFVAMVSQSVRFGTSVADTMRIYAEEFRDKRIQRAEEKAAKVSTLLIFPLVICIFPAFFAVAIGPAVIAIIRAFQSVS